jgi:hypothetical protein
MARKILQPKQKALEINLDETIYGTFSEIGAGQEVARQFFQAGAAAGTIAKTMSAYDKTYSDRIYGNEPSGRYVCESRLYKMLDHEYELMEERLNRERPESRFFAFANTVAAMNYSRTITGDGWFGLRFQLDPDDAANDIVLHVKMLDNTTELQQQALGVLGVNLVYACYKYSESLEEMVISLMDNLEDRVSIDMLRLTGPNFGNVDNRLLALYLVKNKMTDVAMFGADKQNIHASEFLYRKNVIIVRGSYRPTTLVNLDMIKCSELQFRNEEDVDAKKADLLCEITFENLMADGHLDEKDFLDRTNVLCSLGLTVAISREGTYKPFIKYLSDFKVNMIGFVIGSRELLELINDKFYQHSGGSLLAAFGEIFNRNIRFYVYPAIQEGSEELMTCANLPIPDEIQFLYKHLMNNKQITDIEGFDKHLLHIYSKNVLEMIGSGEEGWEAMVLPKIARMIKNDCLFNFPLQKLEFEY